MTGVYVRLAAAVAAVLAGAAGIIVAIALLRSVPGPAPTTLPSAPAASGSSAPAGAARTTTIRGGRIGTPGSPSFPSPPPGAVVFAREAGTRSLALALLPSGGKTLARVSVLAAAGNGAAGLDVRAGAAKLAPCGPGCYQALVPTPAREVTVSVGTRRYRFAVPGRTSDGAAIVARAASTWHALRTLVWHERLAGSPTDVLHTVYEAVAPNELSYSIEGGSSSVIIGGTRWDRPSAGSAWQKSAQDPQISEPQPFWAKAEDAHVTAAERYDGRPVWQVTFFDPTTPAWYSAEIERASSRTLELDMIAASHFMHHVYGPFDAKLHISAPST